MRLANRNLDEFYHTTRLNKIARSLNPIFQYVAKFKKQKLCEVWKALEIPFILRHHDSVAQKTKKLQLFEDSTQNLDWENELAT